MNKIVSNIKYKMGYQYSWIALYIGIYLAIMLGIYFALIKTDLISAGEGSLIYRVWGSVFVHFGWTMRFKEDFDFLVTLSSTRMEIFYSLLGVAFIFSAIFSFLISLEKLIVDYLNNVFGYFNISDPFHFFSPYVTDNIFLVFFYFFMLCLCLSIFGLLSGSLFYRFGKKSTTAYWLVISSIPSVFFPLYLWALYKKGELTSYITDMVEFLRTFDLLAGSGYMFLLTIVFAIGAYLNIRRLPQN